MINDNKIDTDFHVVDKQFPVPQDGILGQSFLLKNKAIIDISNNKIIINPQPENSVVGSKCIILEPRSETIVCLPIADSKVENKAIIINKQEVTQDVYCGNVIGTVRNGKVLVSMLNISEVKKEINNSDISTVLYNNENEFITHKINIINDNDNRLEKINQLIRTDHMNNEERESILDICKQFSGVFHLKGDKLTFTDATEHEINLKPNQKSIYCRPYRLAQAQQAEIDSQIKQMEQDDIIEPSKSPWNAPLLLVKKKLDASNIPKFRIVVDFRKLNEATMDEFHPLPNITEILDQLGQCQLFTVLDLASGFYQIQLAKASRELTAFSTLQGHWHFKRLVMGLKTSPATFQRLMNTVLSGLIGLKCLVYLDDIVIFAKNLIQHNNKLIEVFQRLQDHNLKIQPDKCEFLKRECNYLGHVISQDGIKPCLNKIQSVLNFPTPKTVKHIKSYLGLTGYYRKFINGYSGIAKPLTNLLKKDVKFNWSDECQNSFDKLKSILCKEPILQFPDFTKPFILTSDASQKALAAILSQGEVGKDLPIAYASRTLNKAENNYSTTELECLAIVYGVTQFRPYLYGRKFIIYSDHRPLVWLFNLKNPLSKLARWRIQLEEYSYEIRYKPGVQNSNVDALSRMYTISQLREENYDTFLEKIKTVIITNNNVKETVGTLIDSPIDYHIVSEIAKQYNFKTGLNYELKQKFAQNQLLPPSKIIGDINYFKLDNRFILFIVTKNRDKQLSTFENIYIALTNLKQFCEENNLIKLVMNKLGQHDNLEWDHIRSMIRFIFRGTKIEILICTDSEYSDDEKLILIKQFHDSLIGGHQGVSRTSRRLKKQFSWRGLKQDVRNYIKTCTLCQKNKISNKHVRSPMVVTSTSSRPFEKVILDIVGPLPKSLSGNCFVLTLQDDLSKFSLGIPLPNHTAQTVAEAFTVHFVCIHGIPDTILTDQGTDFMSKTFTEMCKLLKINKINSSAFHPQSQGGLERSHRTLKEYLRSFVDIKLTNWDVLLPYFFFTYNSTEHSSTKYQPYALVYGRDVKVPIKLKAHPEPRYNYDDYISELKHNMQESHKIARENLITNKKKSKERYDIKENPIDIQVKDLVLLKDNTSKTKLEPLWLGPFEVIAIIERENIVIRRGRKNVTIHKNNVKKYYNDQA